MGNSFSEPKISIRDLSKSLNMRPYAINNKLKSLGLHSLKTSGKSYITHETANSFLKIPFKKRKLAFQSCIANSGKTSAVHNISCAASSYGAKVLVIDLDHEGTLTAAFNQTNARCPVLIDLIHDVMHNKYRTLNVKNSIIKVHKGVDLLPSNIWNAAINNSVSHAELMHKSLFDLILGEIEDEYDFIFMDCPNHQVGNAVTAATLYADTIIIPINESEKSLYGLNLLKNHLKTLEEAYSTKIKYKIFLNKFSGNTIFPNQNIRQLLKDFETGKILKTAVRNTQNISKPTYSGLNVFSTIKETTAREDFDMLTKEILNIQPIKN